MAMSFDAELLAALELAVQFVEQAIRANELLVAGLVAGRQPTPSELQELTDRLTIDRNQLERFRLRVGQLRAQQRPH